MDFEELVNLARTANADNPLPADYADQLNNAMISELESRDATIEQLTNDNAGLDGKLKEYAVKNYELMKNQPLPQNGDGVNSGNDNTPLAPLGVDGLMKKVGL